MTSAPCSAPIRNYALLALALALAPQAGRTAQPAASIFNEGFLGIGGDQPNADLSVFKFGNQVLPGSYMVNVVRDGNALGQSQLRFEEAPGKRDAQPCLTRSMLESWGVNTAAIGGLATLPPESCVDLATSLPDASYTYDAGRQQLSLSIPQAALKRTARGAIDPSKWDRGINAAMLDYQFNLTQYDGTRPSAGPGPTINGPYGPQPDRAARNNAVFAGLRGGFNLGDWRFRNYSTYNRDQYGQGRWQAVQTYAQRDLRSIRGQLLLGDGSTPGELFDSVQFRGVQIASDDSMLPDSLNGYAPTIRGVAQTNARVTVRQNGYIIYSTYVPPGPFALDDLYPTSAGGDLDVTVTEADGRETHFVQAYAAVPTLLRDGAWRYSATVGQYRNGYVYNQGDIRRPYFLQATAARGMPMDFTLYGGTTLAQNYQSLLAGAGKNMRSLGAVSLDLTQARTQQDQGGTLSGQSLRFLYAKSLEQTGTNFRMAGYRYSTSGYRTFPESVQMRYAQEYGLPFANRRNEIRLDVSQPLGNWGSVYVSARQQSYWNSSHTDKLVQLGYSGSYGQVNYNLFYNQYSNQYGPSNRQVMLTLSIPLGKTGATAMYSASHDSNGRVAQQASLFGSAMDDYRLTYGITANQSNQDSSSGSANLNYKGRYGNVTLGRSQGSGYGQTNLGLAGGIVAHGDGVTLSQPLGETIALVRAPKASGVGVESQAGVSTDSAGNAVVPNVTPYRSNRLALVTQDLDDSVDVKYAARDVVPTRGAVVLAPFETSVGYRLMLTLKGRDGRALPFGSRIENEAGQEVGIVGPEGQAYVSGAPEAGTLKVIWGQDAAAQCEVKYALPREEKPSPIRQYEGSCS